MKSDSELHDLAELALRATIKASSAIMETYQKSFDVEIKDDGSPITDADKKANDLIFEFLSRTDIPIISEETPVVSYEERQQWEYLWVVDPLDGTKEFVDKNGEFTVNIALVHYGSPVLGVIAAPALAQAWWGIVGTGVFKLPDTLSVSTHAILRDVSVPVACAANPSVVRVGVSRSHLEQQTLNLIQQIQSSGQAVQTVVKGSSLKFCLLAEGALDIYARYSQTHEWDIAAGHAILRAQGGELFHITRHTPLEYNKRELKSPGFIAFAQKQAASAFFEKFSF